MIEIALKYQCKDGFQCKKQVLESVILASNTLTCNPYSASGNPPGEAAMSWRGGNQNHRPPPMKAGRVVPSPSALHACQHAIRHTSAHPMPLIEGEATRDLPTRRQLCVCLCACTLGSFFKFGKPWVRCPATQGMQTHCVPMSQTSRSQGLLGRGLSENRCGGQRPRETANLSF